MNELQQQAWDEPWTDYDRRPRIAPVRVLPGNWKVWLSLNK